jgi:Protein of unknown function (DUF4235)
MAKLLYLPFALIGRLISARIGRSVFKSVWTKLDDEPPPSPGSDASTSKVVAAHALQAGVMAGVAAAVDHTSARVFHHLIGVWPAKRREEPD